MNVSFMCSCDLHSTCLRKYGTGVCECLCHDNPAHLASTSPALRPTVAAPTSTNDMLAELGSAFEVVDEAVYDEASDGLTYSQKATRARIAALNPPDPPRMFLITAESRLRGERRVTAHEVPVADVAGETAARIRRLLDLGHSDINVTVTEQPF